MRKDLHRLFVFIIILALVGPALGCSSSDQVEPHDLPSPADHSLTAENMQAFFDNYLEAQMDDLHIAGAAASVVLDGQVLFSKGYGYADVDQQIPVDPDNTLFILGSLSKIFTWTAVMQLVEQGQLDLNADVNSYLDFEIPDTYAQPITLLNLMNHNAGFEDLKFEQMESASGHVTPLGKWVRTHIPERIRRPGQYSAYGNYGATLAGYIIERISGLSYDDYLDQHILTPLGMTHTTARQPIPADLEANASQAYRFSDGNFQNASDYNVLANVAPAGAVRSTASDMARFMIAHLNNGSYGDASILQPETAQLMHNESFTHDPLVNGMAHGFWEMDMNGQQIMGHAGSHFIFNSLLMLLPEHNLGVFVVTNSAGGMAFLGGENYIVFQQAFMDYFFPQTLPDLTAPSDFKEHADRFTGSYSLTMGHAESNPEHLFGMMMAWDIKADGDELVLPALDNAHFVQIEPLVFRQVDDDTLLVFHEDSSGTVSEVFISIYPQSALIKNRWFETPTFNLGLLVVCLLLFFSFPIVRLVAFIIQRRRAKSSPPSRKLSRTAQSVGIEVSLLCLGVAVCTAISLLNTYGLFIGDLPLWPLVTVFSIVVVVEAVVMLVLTVLLWVRRVWGLARRTHYTLLTLGVFGFVWFMSFWHILGSRF